jgi:hypothetical protein
MEKHKLLSLVNKTSSYFDDYTTPTSVYKSLWDDTHFKPLLDRMSAEDIIFYSFLVPIKMKGQDIDESYDRIEHNMYSVELVEIYNTEPEVDCPECRNGREECDNCDGEYTCGYCEGSGQVVSKDKIEVEHSDYISWSNRWKMYFFDKKPDQQLDSEDTRNFHNNSQTLFLGMHEEITDEYQGYENGDILLWVAKDTKDLNLRKFSDRVQP